MLLSGLKLPESGRIKFRMTNDFCGRLLFRKRRIAHAGPMGLSRLAIAVIVLIGTAHAQTIAGVVRGVIVDPSGAHVSGATVTLTRQETGAQRSAASDAQGEFTITGVAPGEYRLEAQHQGFLKYTRTLIVEVDQDQKIRVELGLDAAGKVTVDVAGIAPLVRPESPAMGGVIDNRQVLGIPLDGRDFFELSLLLPGVAPAAEGSAGSVRGAFSISVNGAREDANNFLLDGAYNGDPKLNGVSVTPPVDAIREFEVATSTYDSSFGRNAGGQINVVTRSGGNQFHGTAYEFLSDGALDGNNFFAPSGQPAPLYRRNQFGGTLGGPLVRDRTFFFVDYQGTRTAAGQTLVTNVPTLAERNGDFSQSNLVAIDPTSGQPLPGNIVPQYYLNPTGVAIAALYPLPDRNVTGANFVSSPSLTDNQNQFDIRLDHAFRQSDTFFARYSFVDDNLFDPFAGSAGDSSIPGYGIQVPSRAQNVALGETHIFTPALLNDLRLAFNRVSNGDYQQGQGTSVNRQLGLPELSTNLRDWGLTLTSVNGFSPIGDDPTTPEHGTTNTYQIADSATWVRGRHLVKFGFDFRLLQQNAYRDIESRGFFNFTGLLLGNPLEELLLGAPTETGGVRAIQAPILVVVSHRHVRGRLSADPRGPGAVGAPRRIVSFVLPLGYSFNLDGSMMYCTFATLFIAQAYGIHLTGPAGDDAGLLMVTSKGMAGVPRASIVVIAATLPVFHLPEAGLLLILGVDHLLDMGRSATNVVGNSVATVVVSRWEKQLGPGAAAATVVEAEAVAVTVEA